MSSHEVNRVGKRRIEAELLSRGAASVTPVGKHKVLLYATNLDRTRTVDIYVKTKQKGNWHTKIEEGKLNDSSIDLRDETSFWVFMELSDTPKYYIVPDRWIRNDIHEAHQQYLNKHGGHRSKNDLSNHHSINESRIEQWQDRWDILGIF